MTPRRREPEPAPDLTAIVLAGGGSSRFGADKLAADLGGHPLLDHAISAAAQVATHVVVVTGPTGRAAQPRTRRVPPIPGLLRPGPAARLRVVADREPQAGPLAGLVTGLAATATARAIVVGGDMPRLVPGVLRGLADLVGGEHPAAVLEVPGRIQPLPLAVSVGPAATAADRLLAGGARSLVALVGALGAVRWPAAAWRALDPEADTIVDVDHPRDLEGLRAAARLGR